MTIDSTRGQRTYTPQIWAKACRESLVRSHLRRNHPTHRRLDVFGAALLVLALLGLVLVLVWLYG